MEHLATKTSRVRFHKATVTRLQVYNPNRPAADSGPSMCADFGCSTILIDERTTKAAGLQNTEPSNVTIQTASGHINSAINKTTVLFALGLHNKASVLANKKTDGLALRCRTNGRCRPHLNFPPRQRRFCIVSPQRRQHHILRPTGCGRVSRDQTQNKVTNVEGPHETTAARGTP